MGNHGRSAYGAQSAETFLLPRERLDFLTRPDLAARERLCNALSPGKRNVVGQAHDETVSRKELCSEAGEPLGVVSAMLCEVVVHLLQMADVGDAADDFVHRATRCQLCGRAAIRKMGARDSVRHLLRVKTILSKQLANRLYVVKLRLSQNFGSEGESIVRPRLERGYPDGEIWTSLAVLWRGINAHRRVKAPKASVTEVAQVVKRTTRRAKVREKMREEGKVGKLLGRKVLCAEMALGVENSICMSVRTHNRHSASLDDFAGDVSALLRNVGQRQARELRKVLWFGRTCLELLKGAAFCKHLVEFLFAPSGLYRGERFLFRLGVLRGNRLGRRHRKLHDVRIIDKAFLEQLLEPAGRDLPAKRGEYRIVAERICRVAAVVPELGRVEIDIKPARRGAGVFLPDMKLGAVENRLYAGVVEPFCGKAGKRFANRFADGIDILGLDALDRQSRPYLRHLAAAPVEVFAKPRVDERLFQR